MSDNAKPASGCTGQSDCSLVYDETTVGEVVRWYCQKCRKLALSGDYEGSKRVADESVTFESIVHQFHRANASVSVSGDEPEYAPSDC